MFTGIIGEMGIVKDISKKRNVYRLNVYVKKDFDSVKTGDSISINGVCLTLVDIRKNHLAFDIMEETIRNTSFRYMKKKDVVNIESALKAESPLGGHFVLGHVDSVERIKSIKKDARSYIDVAISSDDKMYVVRKGSIAIDGISLTIGENYGDRIRTYLIPHTLQNTNLKYRKINDWVNIEFDILGKYIQNRPTPLITEKFLKEKGFV